MAGPRSGRCPICSNPRRKEIERSILLGMSFHAIGRAFGVCRKMARDHQLKGHIGKRMLKASEALEVRDANDLVSELRQLADTATRIGQKAEHAEQYSAAMRGIGEMVRITELIAKLTGQLDESARVNVLIQEREARDSEQLMMLERLSIEERAELSRFIAKAEGRDAGGAAVVEVAALTDGRGEVVDGVAVKTGT